MELDGNFWAKFTAVWLSIFLLCIVAHTAADVKLKWNKSACVCPIDNQRS